MRSGLLPIAILSLAALAPAHGQQPEDPIDSLLARYEKGDYHVIERAVTTYQEFEALRKSLGFEKDGQRYGALARWDAARRPGQPVFMLELALAGHNRGWRYWLDVLEEARKFVTSRQAPPGERPSEDAFEIAWHKAAVALLLGLNRPDLVEAHGIGPLRSRLAAAPLATGEPRLVDPWIALARGMLEEQWANVEPATAGRRAVAVQLFDDASHYDATRAEALVRKARMLEGSGRPAEAVAALDAIAPRIDDPAIAYWRCLFRGRALGDLDRFEEAARAFEDARRLVPDAPSATVALMALELRRNRAADAYVWADAVRKAPPGMTDPWWQYATGDFRFFAARLVTLRRMMRQ